VHEVGNAEFSPLRAPPSTQKAWKEVPLWRRPPVLALEALLTTGLIGGFIWSTFQSTPAIAFYERDWVVMGDVQNLSREKLFNDSLNTAMRVGLEQSAYVNVISDAQEEEALKRMQREGKGIDRQTGAELALREGAKALVLPTLTEVGGHLRITAEVIDPNTGVTVYTESADAKNADAVLPAIDSVLEKLRTRLGEPISLVDEKSKPLEQVTTPSIEALRAYTMGQEAKKNRRFIEARNLNMTALKLDPDFALAYVAVGTLDYIENDYKNADRNWKIAESKRDRLTLREAMWLDVTSNVFSPPGIMLPKWKALAAMYPDEYLAYYNFAFFSYLDNLEYQKGLDFLKPAYTARNPKEAGAYYLKGLLSLALNDANGAKAAFEKYRTLDPTGYNADHAAVYAVQRDYAAALKLLGEQDSSGTKAPTLFQEEAKLTYAVDSGRWTEAYKELDTLRQIAKSEAADMVPIYEGMQLSLRSYAPDGNFASDLKSHIAETERHLLKQDHPADRKSNLFSLLAAGVMAANTGNLEVAGKVKKLAQAEALQSGQPILKSMAICLDAEILLEQGDAKKAVILLNGHINKDNELYYARAVRMRALQADGQDKAALQEAEWLIANRGLAYIESNNKSLWKPSNLIESNLAILTAADIESRLGLTDQAEKRNKEFLAVWPGKEAQKIARQHTPSL